MTGQFIAFGVFLVVLSTLLVLGLREFLDDEFEEVEDFETFQRNLR